MRSAWQVLVDRGGTFTDIVAVDPEGRRHVRKVLSEDPRRVGDAAVAAIRDLTGRAEPGRVVGSVKMGTTVATNALLERKGAIVCLAITRGLGDALVIGTQQRPELFALNVEKPGPLAAFVVEIDERTDADGRPRRTPDTVRVLADLDRARQAGARSLAVVLVHGFAHPDHERLVAELGRRAGFDHVSVSHEVAPEVGLVARGDTTSVDAYLTPLLVRHVEAMRSELGRGPVLRFMQSSGGLVEAGSFRGRDAILSGPAGGVVAMARVAEAAGVSEAIGLDMGGTSTDVSRWSATDGYERVPEREVAGVRLRAPMMDIVTVAAGGGSILGTDGRRLTVGPESAGAVPGPAAYRRGGPPTVTDANVVLGRLQPEWFPRCFGPEADAPLDVEASRRRLAELGAPFGMTPEEAAAGFVRVANDAMGAAIRELSVARGRDARDHALVCFGGAGPQHACALAESLGVRTVLLHPLAGVLSAWGMGLADVSRQATFPVLGSLEDSLLSEVAARAERLAGELTDAVHAEGVPRERIAGSLWLDLRYRGVEEWLVVPASRGGGLEGAAAAEVLGRFEERHRGLFGFVKDGCPVEIVNARVEVVGRVDRPPEPDLARVAGAPRPSGAATAWFDEPDAGGEPRLAPFDAPIFERARLGHGHEVVGPALIMEETSTLVVDPGWVARVDGQGVVRLRHESAPARRRPGTRRDPVELALFASAFQSIATQMGETLRRIAHSTNVKERLDYSCALFTADGRLIANAPHVPVHLGAMGETVRVLLEARGTDGLRPGQVLVSNDPHRGGSHLPDVTVVTPVFTDTGDLAFLVGNRGHHADVGGIRPGSMPPSSTTIHEEGVVLHDVLLVDDGRFQEAAITRRLTAPPHPVRDLAERLSDLRSQVAANEVGVRLLRGMIDDHGLDVAQAQALHVLDDGAEATREVLGRLPPGPHRFEDAMDDGTRLAVAVTIRDGNATFDFTGTASQVRGNLNAPRAVTRAAVLYVLRSLVERPIPLNDGCLEPIEIVVPPGTLLSPTPPAAVAGGNVETSQRIVDVLLGALGAAAASQGTMNNLTFGDLGFGYYETIGGGTGAGPGFAGASAVHSHMTNTRITDVEVLERRHPVLVREFSVRRGSGGPGRFRGGDGLVRCLEFLAPLSVSMLSERRVRAPFGLAGGMSGARGRNVLRRADGSVEKLPGRFELEVGVGDRLVVETPGGGGYGTPRGEGP